MKRDQRLIGPEGPQPRPPRPPRPRPRAAVVRNEELEQHL